MGKLQIVILAVIIISVFMHAREQAACKDHYKNLIFKKQKDRILYLDTIRLIATLFVVLVHCLDFSSSNLKEGTVGLNVVRSLSSILMICNTLFIMNSGALILNKTYPSLRDFYRKRFTQVGIPFLCYYAIYLRLSTQYTGEGFLNGITKAVKDIAAGPIDWAPHLWVIYVILSLYLFAPFFAILLRHLSEPMLHSMVILILLFRCISLYLPLFGISVDLDLMILPWEGTFLLGYYFAQPCARKYKKTYLILGAVSLVFTVICAVFRTDYKAILLADGAPAMNLMGGALFLMLREKEHKLFLPGFITTFLTRYSYSILLVHWAVLYFVRERFAITENTFGLTGSTITSFFLVLVISAVFSFLFDQTVVYFIQRLFSRLNSLKK